MRLPRITKKKFVAGALAAGLVMGAGGVAFAYFSSHATAQGDADVGTFTATVTVSHTNSGTNENPIYAGTPGGNQTFVVTNQGTSPVRIAAATAKITKSATAKTYIVTDTTGQAVPGCYTYWFTLHVDHTTGPTSAVGVTLAAGAAHNQVVTVTLKTSGTTQNACQGKQPLFKLTVTAANH